MKMIRTSTGLAMTLAAVTAACSGAPGTQDHGPGDTGQAPPGHVSLHASGAALSTVRHARRELAADAEGKSPGDPGQPGSGRVDITYHGGPVISNVKVTTVFWGSNVASQEDLDAFYRAIVDSPYVDQLGEYGTPTQKIGRGQFVSSYVDTNVATASTGAQVSDGDVQQELTSLIQSGALPQPDADTLFMVHFPPGVSITTQGATSCQQFCAYHSSFQLGSGNVYYGIMPDYGGSDCSRCWAGEPTQFKGTTVVASHEVAEAITDPNIGVANTTQDESQLAWYDTNSDDGEIADVCEGKSTTVAGYRVTKLWSVRHDACEAPSSKPAR
jgi:hypothetical protein